VAYLAFKESAGVWRKMFQKLKLFCYLMRTLWCSKKQNVVQILELRGPWQVVFVFKHATGDLDENENLDCTP